MKFQNIAISIVLSVILVKPVSAQTSLTSSWKHATLFGWEQVIRTNMFDRTGSYYGPLSDRGFIERYTPKMDDENDINLFSYNFLPTDDYLFFRSPNGLRLAGGDLDAINHYSNLELIGNIEIVKKHHLTYYGNVNSSVNKERLFMMLGYRYLLTDALYLGLEHSIGSKKSDLDINGYAQYGNNQTGLLKVDITLLNYLSNLVYEDLNFGGNYSDSSIVYSHQPFLIQFKAVTPSQGKLRAEMVAGWQNEGIAEVQSLTTTNEGYKHREAALYYGGLLEYSSDFYTLGSIYRTVINNVSRDSVGGSVYNPKYEVSQTTVQKGFYLLAHSNNLFWETWLWFNSYEDKQVGKSYPLIATIDQNFQHNEEQILMRNRIYYRPSYKGWIAGVEHVLDTKEFTADIPQNELEIPVPPGFDPIGQFYPGAFHGNNSRLMFTLGYQVHPRARFIVMAGYDLDNDLHVSINGARFDNIAFNIDVRW